MKICLISFDFWGFDGFIISELQRRGIQATHINLNDFKYKHPSVSHKIANSLSKLLFHKNIKETKRQEYILKKLNEVGNQDTILIIRPDLLDRKTHEQIKKKTGKYIAYLYDSTKRFPVDHLLKGLFDKIFSFDEQDVAKYNFEHISNYIYLPKKDIKPGGTFKYKVFIVISADERLDTLNGIAKKMETMGISYKFVVRASRKPKSLHPGIEYRKNEIWCNELLEYLDESEIFLDLVRHGHNGLSFRIFEAMAYQRKLITTNISVKNYDLYNPQNIAVIKNIGDNIDPSFFETPYVPLPEKIYNKYSIKNWADVVFFS